MRRIAFFISPHGFGHASRAAAIMEAIHEIDPLIRFEIFTKVPSWFFRDSISGAFDYHSLLTDIGLVQKTSLHEDIGMTARTLDDFLPFNESLIAEIAGLINRSKCNLVICDIAPMGIAAAREAGIPSMLVENFTWDWIYEGYAGHDQINKHVSYLRDLFAKADFRIQTEPVCCYQKADLITSPVIRKIRTPREQVRKKLGITDNKKTVMVTMGGTKNSQPLSEVTDRKLRHEQDVCFVVPGAADSVEIYDNIVCLPHKSDFFHPDLVNACDAVIGKVGYSTLAEVYQAGVPFGYISRPTFPESDMLVRFIEKNMPGIHIEEAEYQDGSWIDHLEELLSLRHVQRSGINGAGQAAQFIYKCA
ncbi:MAG: hypothetical protein GY749_44900 [Desulfobacteraceae bacterium]|nr:hypothetical protein [Desulfobacteraceae bacterium]